MVTTGGGAMGLEFYSADELAPDLLGEIEDFLDSQETCHLFQFPQWSAAGARCALLREGGRVRWFSSFGTHRPLRSVVPAMRAAIVNRGPVCDDRELWRAASEEFLETMKREGFTYVDAMPDWVRESPDDREDFLRRAGWERAGEERASLRLDLGKDEAEIFANFRKNSRYEMRRAERVGVSVASANGEAEIKEFLGLHARVATRKGFAADAADDLRGAISWLTSASGRGALLLARWNGTLYGGAVIGRCGKRCWYVWGANEKYEHFNVGHILQWNALRWAKSNGCTQYDFGGYTPGATSGPAWFKAGFGGEVVRFVAPHRRVLRPGYYRAFTLAQQARRLSPKLAWARASLW